MDARFRTLLLAALCVAPLAAAQQGPDVKIAPPGEEPPRAQGESTRDAEQRLRELFAEVERKLEGIDVLLTDAAAGDTTSLGGVRDAGIDRLLRDSIGAGREVQRNLEELLEIARQMSQQPGTPGSSGGQQSQSPGGSKSGNQQGQDQVAGEQTPSMPGEDTQGQQPDGQEQGQGEGDQQQAGGEEPQGQQPGQEPKSPEGSHEDGQDRAANERDGGQASRAGQDDPGDQGWGNLPPRLQSTFRAEGRGELPSRYRDWIDQYYVKLNQRSTPR
ncbi:MAG: hypothetical protein H6828_07540 [Planctomycetes bacterium]|nr:hypothetical protein [Planctomycetota bacterium]